MGGWGQAVSSELWLFAKREGESPEGRKEMGDHRVAAAQNCSEGEVIRNFPAKCFLSFFVRNFCRKWPTSVNSQLQIVIRELTDLLFAHFSFVHRKKVHRKFQNVKLLTQEVSSLMVLSLNCDMLRISERLTYFCYLL